MVLPYQMPIASQDLTCPVAGPWPGGSWTAKPQTRNPGLLSLDFIKIRLSSLLSLLCLFKVFDHRLVEIMVVNHEEIVLWFVRLFLVLTDAVAT